MKLSQARPCDKCRGKIAPQFYRVRVDLAFFSPRNANAVLGTAQILGGIGALAVAEAMAPGAEDAIVCAGDKEPELLDTLFICQECYLAGEIDLAVLLEQLHARREGARADGAADCGARLRAYGVVALTSDELYALKPQLEAEARASKKAVRIAWMHARHGRTEGRRCKDCEHLVRGGYFKCRLYGISASVATDWRLKWEACGLFKDRERAEAIKG